MIRVPVDMYHPMKLLRARNVCRARTRMHLLLHVSPVPSVECHLMEPRCAYFAQLVVMRMCEQTCAMPVLLDMCHRMVLMGAHFAWLAPLRIQYQTHAMVVRAGMFHKMEQLHAFNVLLGHLPTLSTTYVISVPLDPYRPIHPHLAYNAKRARLQTR